MFVKKTLAFVFIASFLTGTLELFSQIKPIDYSEQNKSFQKDNLEKENWQNQDKTWQRNSETFEKKTYENREDASHIQDKRYNGTDDISAKSIQNKRTDISKHYTTPNLQDDLKKKWTPSEDNIFLENKNKNLSKKYQGKMDTSKMHQQNAFLKECLEEIQEKSMQDINKYMFRSSHSSDAGVEIMKAGSDIHGEESSSFLEDFFFGKKSIKRSPVSFKKHINVGAVNTKSTHNVKSQVPKNDAKVLPALVQGNTTKPKPIAKENKVKVSEQTFEKETSLFAPRSETGPIRATNKFKISVEVSNP